MRSVINFAGVAAAALRNSDTIVRRWLPHGRREGVEWVAKNPRRLDHRRGSFKVNLRTGRWGDFADNRTGGDLISLAAYLFSLDQGQAAERLAAMLGINAHE